MNADRIKALVADDATLQALQAEGNFGAIAAAINGMALTKVQPTTGGIGLIMRAIGPDAGGSLLDTLEGLAVTNSAVKWALVLVNRGDLDFGDAATRAMIDALCPPEAALALKAVAEVADTTDHIAVMQALEA